MRMNIYCFNSIQFVSIVDLLILAFILILVCTSYLLIYLLKVSFMYQYYVIITKRHRWDKIGSYRRAFLQGVVDPVGNFPIGSHRPCRKISYRIPQTLQENFLQDPVDPVGNVPIGPVVKMYPRRACSISSITRSSTGKYATVIYDVILVLSVIYSSAQIPK